MSGASIPRPTGPLVLASKLHSQDGQLKVYKLDVAETRLKSEYARECTVKAGNHVDLTAQYKQEKTILLVGQSGSGKSTMIDAMLNYIVGVRREDPYRFKLIDLTEEEQRNASNEVLSQTEWVTCYTIPQMHGTGIPYTVKLVDTPGTFSTEGNVGDKVHRQSIRNFLTENGLLFLDAVCFIVKASDPRLTGTQRAIFDDMQETFGNDVAANIFAFVTFCDDDDPPVLKTLKAAKVPYEHHHCVTNVALYKRRATGDNPDPMCVLQWDNTAKHMATFFKEELRTIPACSIIRTKEVCRKRTILEDRLDGLKRLVDEYLEKAEECHSMEIELTSLPDENQEIKVKEKYIWKVYVQDLWVTNCKTCPRTCHERCWAFTNRLARSCKMMEDSKCTICSHPASDHESSNEKIEIGERTVTKTLGSLREEYHVEGKETTDLINAVEERIRQFEADQMERLSDIRRTIEDLNEIALKPTKSTELDYIRSAIAREYHERKEGWKERARGLERLQAKYTHQSVTRSRTTSLST